MELLQRYRRDRRELLNFLLSASVIKKVIMPPGAVSYDDIDLDQISVDYILECARKNFALDLSEAIKRYHDDLSLPPSSGTKLGEVYYLVTNPDLSGPSPTRPPPGKGSVGTTTPLALTYKSSFSLQSTPSRRLDGYDDIDEFEDDDELPQKSNRALNDISDFVLDLPPFATGLSDDDLRETAYEVLLVSVGAAGGLISPAKEKKEEKKSKLVRKFTRNKADKYVPAPTRAPGLAGLMETMRTQMEISGVSDRRTREAILHASAGRVGKRMDTLLVPLELLSAVPNSAFTDKIQYIRWSKRQMNLLLEGLINHPYVGIDPSDRSVLELRALIAKLEEAESLPSPAGPAQHTESLRGIRALAISLAERAGRGDHTGEVCHWADGYHLNVRIYEKLLMSVFDILDEGQLVEEVEEILEMLKSTWRVLGISQTIHDTCYTWVLFRQHVLTGEPALLQHAAQQMKRIASDSQRNTQERFHVKGVRASMDGFDGPPELSYVKSVLVPIKQWADKQLRDYHLQFADTPSKMEVLVTVAMIAGRLISDDKDQSSVARMTSAAEMAAVAKQAEDYICSSVKSAYDMIVEKLESNQEHLDSHPLAELAAQVQKLAKKDADVFSPILSKWHPQAIAISACLLHTLYLKELKPFLDEVSQLTDDVSSVLPAADSLEQFLMELIKSVTDDDDARRDFEQQLTPYQVEVVSGTIVMRWVNTQLSQLTEWVDRAVQQEKWQALSPQQRHGGSIVEVFRIIEETMDQFFKLNLPMRLPQLKGLTNGFDNALQQYTSKVVAQLGDTRDLVPPAPSLTRYKKEVAMKSVSNKKKTADPRLPDERRSSEINLLSTTSLCVRLNTLHYILGHADLLEDNIRDHWAAKRPQDGFSRVNGTPSKRGTGDLDMTRMRESGNRQMDYLSTAFEGSRKAVNAAIDKICEFTGTKLIFWDMREIFIDGLYKVTVSQARMQNVVAGLDPVLGELCDVIVEPLRDRVVLGLLQAALDGLLRVLLDGGPTRGFSASDSTMLEEDVNVLKDFFIAEGDGLPKGVVENAASSVQQILNLYSLDTNQIIESFKRSGEQMAAGANPTRTGSTRYASDADTLLRVLCHRIDPVASKFLKTKLKLSST